MVANIRTGRQPSPTYGCLGTPKPWGRARFPYGNAETAKLLFSGWYITGFVNSAIESRFVSWSLDSFFCIEVRKIDLEKNRYFPNVHDICIYFFATMLFSQSFFVWNSVQVSIFSHRQELGHIRKPQRNASISMLEWLHLYWMPLALEIWRRASGTSSFFVLFVHGGADILRKSSNDRRWRFIQKEK